MNRLLRSLCLPLFFFAAALPAGAEKLLLLHTNDWHGTVRATPALWMTNEKPPTLGGPQALAGALDAHKRRALRDGIRWLQVDAGDRFQGTMEANFSRGMAMTDLYNVLRYTVITLGNHDFDYGKEALLESMVPARFPVVCANLHGSGVPWRSSLVTRVGGLKIGITGVITGDLPSLNYPENIAGLELESPASAARRVTEELRKRGCDLVLLLSHCGHDVDLELARAVPDLDLIVGGHTDHQLNQPVRVGKTLIMQTRGYGSHLGALMLDIDDASKAIATYSYEAELLDPASWPAAPAVDAVVASWSRLVEEIAGRPVGTSPREFLRRPGPDGRSALGMELCRAVSEKSGCPIVVFQLGGLRTDLPAGNIIFKDVYQVLPFNHQILVGSISGRDLTSLLDKGCDRKDAELCIFGAVPSRGPEGFTLTFAGKPVDPDAWYPIALNDFLAKGGDGFEEFTRVKNLQPRGGIIRDAFLEMIGRGQLGR